MKLIVLLAGLLALAAAGATPLVTNAGTHARLYLRLRAHVLPLPLHRLVPG